MAGRTRACRQYHHGPECVAGFHNGSIARSWR
jgi:hypothetical protein